MTRDKTTQYLKLLPKFVAVPVPRRYSTDKQVSLPALERDLNIRPNTLWITLERQGVLVPCETQAPGAVRARYTFAPGYERLGERQDGHNLRVWRDVFTKWIANQIEYTR